MTTSLSTVAHRFIAAASLGLALGGASASVAAGVPAPVCAPNGGFTMADPVGDDNGPGTYIYPTDAVYKPGSFDLTEFQVVPNGDQVEFRVTVNSRIEDPWDSQAWGGNGFSLQMAFIHISTDAGRATGVKDGIAGTNVRFSEPWDKLVILSPQGATRLNSEIDSKAAHLKSRIIVPKITRASGKTLIAVVDVKDLGGVPTKTWGYQVLMQSNEGFPDKTDLLTRKINEFEGQHRFGGGTDYDNDPHVLDMLAPVGSDPVAKQHELLSAYNKNATTDVRPADQAAVPMVWPCSPPQVAGAPAPAAAPAGVPGGVAAVAASSGPAVSVAAPVCGANGSLTFTDPPGDDNGPGSYIYPTDAVYKPGSFDLTEFQVVPNGDQVEFRVTVNSRIEDPWDSQAWGGNGFSLQMAFIHISTDAGRATGVKDGIAGTNVRFAQPWDKLVIISPQGATRLNSEIDSKAAHLKSRIIVPKITRASGKTLIAVVDAKDLGGLPTSTWGYQVLMQSNEGFPDKTDLLTRKINEFEGQHRFGGGTDYDNDPHVIDLIAPLGGDPVAKQHAILSAYNKNATTDVKPEDQAAVPMVFPCVTTVAAGEDPGSAAVASASASAAAPAPRPPGGGGGAPLNFDMNGKIYMKYMYQNDATQGCLSMSNPFWVDNIGGHNGACTEFEMNIKARVSDKVSAGVRLQSRWGALWQDWWENGDLKTGVADTSGESLGMNHAAYIKLRSAFARVAAPIPSVSWITIGSTDFSMWNEWTIGKARYIDRDNGNGVFVEGAFGPNKLVKYTTGAMALPKLWAGPGWNTGLPGNNGSGGDALAKLYGTDWAFAAKLESRVTDDLRLKLIGTLLKDWEPDRYSPFLTGAPDAQRGADHSVAMATRFRGANATLDGQWTPSSMDYLSVTGLLAGSSNYVNPAYATNLVRQGQGFSPVVFKTDEKGNPVDSNGLAGTLLVELFDPLKSGLSAKFQYFNIGSEYNAVMGSRREADVLITDGIIAGGFTRGGQLPTLNIANEFQDWDEPWYESCIGWHGGTMIFEYLKGSLKATGEYSFIGRNTNMQNRDVANQYPDFLHYTHGFTDTTAYSADSDYANSYGRGADPRSVYSQYADRRTQVAVVNLQYLLPKSAVLTTKLKFVDDFDGRVDGTATDDYQGREYLGMLVLALQPTNELKTTLGYEFSYWNEKGRDGTEEAGFHNGDTRRHTFHAGLTYAFGGALLTYQLEYFHKDRFSERPTYYDMKWNVWRSKATFEVAW